MSIAREPHHPLMKRKSRHLPIDSAADPATREPIEGELDLALERSEDFITRLRDTGGVVFVEYVALLTLVTLIGSGAVVALGIPLLNLFRYQELMLSLPIP